MPVDLPDEMLRAKAEEWSEEWVKFGEETLRDVPPGRTAAEILEADRNRLDCDNNLSV